MHTPSLFLLPPSGAQMSHCSHRHGQSARSERMGDIGQGNRNSIDLSSYQKKPTNITRTSQLHQKNVLMQDKYIFHLHMLVDGKTVRGRISRDQQAFFEASSAVAG
ncbi:hypothetical protein BaRGS_00015487 [Batillaria attramentaria]|uniref:Uncharacterized protein n=1 Tax=Batillaria attramentaria TaxID=370345 RepID=A0ABD0L1I1_9CAEN